MYISRPGYPYHSNAIEAGLLQHGWHIAHSQYWDKHHARQRYSKSQVWGEDIASLQPLYAWRDETG
jgi:hypothetical protein